MTVHENLAVGREKSWFGRMEAANDPASTLTSLGIAQYADYQLADLSLAVQQRVEIARAIMCDAEVFLFDEPNSALTEAESEALFVTMSELAARGKIVILITHRLNDFVRYCRRVLVLRDGQIRCEISAADISETRIADELTVGLAVKRGGNEAAAAKGATPAVKNEAALSLRNCTDRRGLFRNVSFELATGRVLALAGVEGSGARELAQFIGQFRPASGDISMPNGGNVAYLAASRRQTIFHNLSVGENLVARLGYRQLNTLSFILSPGRVAGIGADGISRYNVKAHNHAAPVASLSGGNQQKVALGAAMSSHPDILVVEEPTRGVDVASKRDIYALIRSFSRGGHAVVLLCTEVPEIFEAADEVIVMAAGAIAGQFDVAAAGSLASLADQIAECESGAMATGKKKTVGDDAAWLHAPPAAERSHQGTA
jgi:ABC-type sugar transport system ATPase subunit